MSTKNPTQPGRRTPLSLSGAVTKGQANKSGNAANSGGNNSNGHTTSNSNKHDNKLQQQKTEQQTVNIADTKDNPNKKLQQNDNKKSLEKAAQNGVNNKQHQANENKQQNKDKLQQQQQNGNENKLNEKDKKEKTEKVEKNEKSEKIEKNEKNEKIVKTQEKSEKEETKENEDKKQEQEQKNDNKKEEKKVNDAKEDKKETDTQNEQKPLKNDDKKSNDEKEIKIADQKPDEEDKLQGVTIVEEQQSQQKSPPATPKTKHKVNKTSTTLNKTPTKGLETSQKSTSSNSAKTTPVSKREVTTTIDDVDMEPLTVENSPIKTTQSEEVAHINIAPSATSTPGKKLLPKRISAAPKSDVQLAMQTGISPERPRPFSQISGRKSIRPISVYTPSKFQINSQFRESYRRINTELDITNTSMNVTVGSEVPNNLSFSFFGRGRKRDRTPPKNSQSAIGELQTDMEVSPPKRARIDMHGFFSVVSSPISLLRNRFSKATLQSSTPVKLEEKLSMAEDEIEVQNVSGVSVHEEISKADDKEAENNSTNDSATLGEEAKESGSKHVNVSPNQGDLEEKEFKDFSLKSEKTCGMEFSYEHSDIKITETPLQPAVGDPLAKNKKCIVM